MKLNLSGSVLALFSPAKPKTEKPKGTTRKRRGVKLKPTELVPTEDRHRCAVPRSSRSFTGAGAKRGGTVLAFYREPLGRNALCFWRCPSAEIEPTPYQREVSDAHVRRLTVAMDKTKRFLDPIIVVRDEEKGGYLTPNGNHRLTALKELGAKTAIALLVPEKTVAYQILALNIEKAYNLREKAIEVVRLYRELARLGGDKEESYALEFEGPRSSRSDSVTRSVRAFRGARTSGAAQGGRVQRRQSRDRHSERERRADLVLELDDAVNEAIAKLKAKGFNSPYLRTFVVARVNPLRFMKGSVPPMEELLRGMAKRARGMNTDRIKTEDVARTGGAPEAES
jgi:ParB family chromosome partitioning protein